MEKIAEFKLNKSIAIAEPLSSFAQQFTYSAILLSNDYSDKYGEYEFLAAFGAYRILQSNKQSFQNLSDFHHQRKSWIFGHLSYELKDELWKTKTKKNYKHNFSSLSFFEPAYLLLQKRNSETVQVLVNEDVSPTPILDLIKKLQDEEGGSPKNYQFPNLKPSITKEEYLRAFQEIKKEINAGNIVGLNFCQQFYTTSPTFNPYEAFPYLNYISPMPFAAFYKNETAYALCASPERFIRRKENQLITQPIKGTIKRGKTKEEDLQLQHQLKTDVKEQAENQMIVDLVYEDLQSIAKVSSIKVEELFGVYSFPQLHQLISTLTAELAPQQHWISAIKSTFPMGSMLGVPKIKSMELIQQVEKEPRELYSGAIGYVKPNGDFDFNVVIRSLLYNAKTHFLSYSVGGAITQAAIGKDEYEECLLKAKAIFERETLG